MKAAKKRIIIRLSSRERSYNFLLNAHLTDKQLKNFYARIARAGLEHLMWGRGCGMKCRYTLRSFEIGAKTKNEQVAFFYEIAKYCVANDTGLTKYTMPKPESS